MSPILKSASLHGVSSSSLQRPSVRCAAFDNKVEVKRPAMPASPPSPAEPPKRLFNEPAAPSQTAASPSTAPVQHAGPSAATPSTAGGVTVEYQRQRAKEMTKYFKELKLNEAIVKSQVFGWTKPNEISNGRWVMFGLMVGMLTEYATGVDFPHQLLLMCSYLGIVDAE